MNVVFTTALILNDGHEIRDRLAAGDDLADIASDLTLKFGRKELAGEVASVARAWPALHLEAVKRMMEWALSKLDTDDRITIHWKGDDECPDTVTRFELRGHDLRIEFAHPPAMTAGRAAAALSG